MESDGSPRQARGPRAKINRLLLIRIANFSQLWDAYGTRLRLELDRAVAQRLDDPSLCKLAHTVPGEYVFMHGASARTDVQNDDLLCEQISARLSYGPIVCEEEEAYLRVETAVIRRTMSDQDSDEAYTGLPTLPIAQALHEERQRRTRAYRAEMLLALSIYSQLTAGRVCLSFEPVLAAGNKAAPIYWKTSLRRQSDLDDSSYIDCKQHLTALVALGLTDRLDRSILTTVLELLSHREQVRVGYRISSHSLRISAWWRLFLRSLEGLPDIASRLVIEVREDRSMGRDEEAITLLRALRTLGCKLAMVDVGLGGSTFEFLARLRPDFITLNIKELSKPPGRVPPSFRSTYQSLARFCAELAPCVITEAIDTEEDRLAAIASASQGLHGALIAAPSIVPSWHNQPVIASDALEKLAHQKP